MTPQPDKARVFFSAAAGLIININNGHRITEANGISKMIDQKVVEFSPQPDNYGRLTTTDPETIKAMEDRCLTKGDVFEAAEYNRRITPAEKRVELLEVENRRLIDDHNRLLAQIKEQNLDRIKGQK